MYGFRQNKKSKEAQQQENVRASEEGRRLPFPEVGYPDVKPESAFQRSATGMYVLPEENPVLAPLQELTSLSDNTPAAATKESRKAPKVKTKATAPDIAVGPFAREPDATGSGPSSIYPTATGAQAAPLSEDEMIRQYAEKAAGYMKEPREAFRAAQKAATAEQEKELAGMSDTSKGLAALRAAAKLSEPGQQGIGALGAALGAAGETAAQYDKEKRAVLKEQRASGLEAAKAEMAFKQGDYALGAQLMDKSEDRRLKAANLAADKAYKDALVDIEGRKLGETERHNRAEEIARLKYISVLGSGYSLRGQLTPAAMANLRDKANDNVTNMLKDARTLLSLRKQFPGATDDQIRASLIQQETNRLSGLGGAGGPAATPQFDLSKFGEPTVVGR